MNKHKILKYALVGATCLLLGLVFLVFVEPALAQATGAQKPAYEAFADQAKTANTQGWRVGRGMNLCPIKIAIMLIIYLAWVASTGWTNNDAERLGDPDRSKWNGMNFGFFVAGMALTILIPVFWAGLPLLLAGWLVPVFIYVKARNKGMLDADKVMTPQHLSFWFKTKVLRMKVKPKKLAWEGGSPIQLEPCGSNLNEKEKIARTVAARDQSLVGYNFLRELLYHALHARATDVKIEFGVEDTRFIYQIDGVDHVINDAFKKPWLREEADDVARAAKSLIGGNPQSRNTRQSGIFRILYDKNKKGKPFKCDARLDAVGTSSGELFKITFIFETAQLRSLDALGVDESRQGQMRKLINADKGLVLLATAPHQGLKTLTTVIFNTADRFTRDFASVEDKQHPYEVIENISNTTYDSAAGQTPMDVLPDVFFKEPKVLLIRDMVNLESWKLCCDEVNNDRLIITTIRGEDAVAAIMNVLKQGVDAEQLANTLTAVITQRLVRRLCVDCREEVQVTDKRVVSAFGLNPSDPKWFVKHIHEPVAEGEKDFYVPCTECRDIGYRGRIAVFDILEINDAMRQIIAADVDLVRKEQALRKAAMDSGQEGYWADGKRLIRTGVTSYDEMRRVMAPAQNRTRPQGQGARPQQSK